MTRPTEQERFQKWERTLERQLTADDLECLWARKIAMFLDLGELTQLPINHRCHLPNDKTQLDTN